MADKIEKLYNKKIITSGNRVEVYYYQSPQKIDREVANKDGRKGKSGNGAATKENRKINRKTTLNKARNKIIRLCNANPDLNTFITLTYKENFKDLKKSKEHLKVFFKKLNKTFINLKYVYVLEFQERGAIHYHMLCNIDFDIKTSKSSRKKTKQQKELECEFAKTYWSNRGFVDIRNLQAEGNTNAGKYIATYLVEDLMKLDLQGNKCYGFSRNLVKPVEKKIYSGDKIPTEYENYKVTYTSTYQIQFTDKVGNTRTSNVNYYDLYKKENE